MFTEDYYRKTIHTYNYSPMDFAPMDFSFMGIPKEIMRIKWLCHSGIDRIIESDKFIVTTGVGLSGVPHIGTLSQLMRIIFLQKNGVTVQLVLGDLDSFCARNKELNYVMDLAKRYREFTLKLGFDAGKGVLRNQLDFPQINQYAYLLSKCLADQDFLDTEEDLSSLYIEKKVYAGITFPVKQAILLMIADFLYLEKEGYSEAVVMLGLEEHRYVLLARKIIERLGLPINLYSMYSRIINGLNGYPKMSKSIQGSSITVDMSAHEIKHLINDEPNDYDCPENSVVFQMISSVSDYSPEELTVICKACCEKNSAWELYKKDYAGRMVNWCAKWQ